MHRKLVTGICVAGLCWAGARPLRAQTADARARLGAVAGAMAFRRGELGDATPFDACTVFRETGEPRGLLNGILPGLRGMLDRPSDAPCAAPAPSAEQRFKHIVQVVSVAVHDTAGQVQLSVTHGEWNHRETYFFERRGEAMTLREVRMLPGIQLLPPPSTAPPATGNTPARHR